MKTAWNKTKFTKKQIQNILNRFYERNESGIKIAKSYGVSWGVIYRVVRGIGDKEQREQNRRKKIALWAKNDKKIGQYKRTDEWKKNSQSLWRKGNIPWNKGGEQTQETKDKVRASVIRHIEKNGYKFLKTKPHLVIKKAMQERGVYKGFKTEGIFACSKFSVNVDELNRQKKIAVFVDGDFWHGLRFCESDVYGNLDSCMQRLEACLQK